MQPLTRAERAQRDFPTWHAAQTALREDDHVAQRLAEVGLELIWTTYTVQNLYQGYAGPVRGIAVVLGQPTSRKRKPMPAYVVFGPQNTMFVTGNVEKLTQAHLDPINHYLLPSTLSLQLLVDGMGKAGLSVMARVPSAAAGKQWEYEQSLLYAGDEIWWVAMGKYCTYVPV